MMQGLGDAATVHPLAVAGVTAGADHLVGEATAGKCPLHDALIHSWIHILTYMVLCTPMGK